MAVDPDRPQPAVIALPTGLFDDILAGRVSLDLPADARVDRVETLLDEDAVRMRVWSARWADHGYVVPATEPGMTIPFVEPLIVAANPKPDAVAFRRFLDELAGSAP